MTIGERVKKVRKELHLTQQEFAEKIGLKPTAVLMYEKGNRNVTEQSISLICRTFRVNEEWLRSGVGEMFLKSDGNILSELADEFNLKRDEEELVSAFLNLTEEQRRTILKAVKIAADISGKLEDEPQLAPNAAPIVEEVTRDNITNEELELVRQSRIQKNINIDNNSGTINF